MDERRLSMEGTGTGDRHVKVLRRIKSLAPESEIVEQSRSGSVTTVSHFADLKISDRMSSPKNTWKLRRTLGGPGGLESACGIAALHPDEIAVTDSTKGQVIFYSTEGTVKRAIQTTSVPLDIEVTHDNRLVVASVGATHVKVFNKDNTLAFQFPTVPPSEVGKTAVDLQSVAVKKDGTIIVGDVKRMVLTEHSPTDGSLIRTIPVKTEPYFLAVDSDDRIFIGDLHAVHVFAISSNAHLFNIQPTIDGEPVKYCRGVCVHGLGIFVVTGTSVKGHIHRYDTQGKFLGCAVQGLHDPWGITFSADGRYLAVADKDSVKMYIDDSARATTGKLMGSDTSGQGSRRNQDEGRTDVPRKGTARPMYYACSMDCEPQLLRGQAYHQRSLSFGCRPRAFETLTSVGASRKKKNRRRKRNQKKRTEARTEDLQKCEAMEVSCTKKTENTSSTDQDKATQQSRVNTHLQMVLGEFSKLTENLSDSERFGRSLKLPYIAIGYFDEKGGRLSLDEHDVQLTIPRGAMRPGPPQQVYIYIDPTTPSIDGVKPPEVALSPMIKCGPEGLRFEENVVLSFPHHATMPSQKYRQLAVRMRHDEPLAGGWEQFDGDAALVTEKKVILLVGHFTNFTLVGTPSTGSSKRMKVGAFGGLLDRHCPQYAFRVHFWDDDKGAEQEVLQKENRLESKILDDFRNMEFYWGLGNLAVKVSDIEGGWSARRTTEQTIHKEKIRIFPSNSVTFNLKRQAAKLDSADDEGLYCAVCSYQSSENEDLKKQTEVCLSICPQQVNIQSSSERPKCIPRLAQKFSSGPYQKCELRSGENKGDNCCTCGQEAAASPSLCSRCKEKIANGILIKVHGDVDPQEYGGLPRKTVFCLCNHLDTERDGGNNWKQLVEGMTDFTGRSVVVFERSGKIHTSDLLKLYFEVCRNNDKTNREAVETLTGLFGKQGLHRAVEIVNEGQEHVK